jgi:methylated-DNA-protein-cysteine methyltransferase-like protein
MAKRKSAGNKTERRPVTKKPSAKQPAGRSTARKAAARQPSKAGTNKKGKASAADLPKGRKPSASAKDPFAEKLNTVTPSGYKDQTFFEQVFDVARQIPKGRVTSYGAIAASLGAKSSSRLVGWAMNLAGNAKPKVPAHRVVNRNGMLSGKHHFATPTQMQELLEKEGIQVKKDKVVDFSKLFWDPMDLGE